MTLCMTLNVERKLTVLVLVGNLECYISVTLERCDTTPGDKSSCNCRG